MTDRMVSVKEIRKYIANYMATEGCSCCQDVDGHAAAKADIARLLSVPMYKDKSGYNFHKFNTVSIINRRP